MTKIMAISKLLQNIRRGFFDLYDPVEKHFCVFLLEKAKNVRWSEKLYTIVYPIKKSFFRWKVEFFFVENTNFCKKFCEWIFNFFNSKITYFIFFFHNVSAGGGRYRRYLTRAFGMFFFLFNSKFSYKKQNFFNLPDSRIWPEVFSFQNRTCATSFPCQSEQFHENHEWRKLRMELEYDG